MPIICNLANFYFISNHVTIWKVGYEDEKGSCVTIICLGLYSSRMSIGVEVAIPTCECHAPLVLKMAPRERKKQDETRVAQNQVSHSDSSSLLRTDALGEGAVRCGSDCYTQRTCATSNSFSRMRNTLTSQNLCRVPLLQHCQSYLPREVWK